MIFDTAEAAAYVRFAVTTLERYRLTGEGPKFLKIGKKSVRYRQVDLDDWLDSRVVGSTSEVRP